MVRLYLETSVVSYLTARPSLDIITAAHQHLTQRWWSLRRKDFEMVTSELVLEEAGRGNAEAAAKRLGVLATLPLLDITTDALGLAQAIVEAHLLPARALPDAIHIGVAAIHQIPYLLTWNCTHIANAELLPRVTERVENAGWPMPFVCTPEELLGDRHVR